MQVSCQLTSLSPSLPLLLPSSAVLSFLLLSQLAVLYKYRADVRANLFRFADAVQDYSAAIKEQEKAEANAGITHHRL